MLHDHLTRPFIASKHFHNDPNHLVLYALRSLIRTNPSVAVDSSQKTVYIRTPSANHVAIISGGGSGHEPAFGAYVGHGLLTAAIAGSIFASPSTEQIYQCLMRCVDHSHGVMVILMNYTGDAPAFRDGGGEGKGKGCRSRHVACR